MMYSQGRMVNDVQKGDPLENCSVNVVIVDKVPHLCMFAVRAIEVGEELRYDYGDTKLPWRKKVKSSLYVVQILSMLRRY